MEAIIARDEMALTLLFERHGDTLRALIEGIVHEPAEVEDVMQETLLQVWKQARNYLPHMGKPISWIITISRRRAIDRLRRRQAYTRVKDRYGEQLASLPVETRDLFDGDAELTRADMRRFLGEQMAILPRFQREALVLSYFTGMSHREIAATTEDPLGTVKTRLELGLQKLQSNLRPVRQKI